MFFYLITMGRIIITDFIQEETKRKTTYVSRTFGIVNKVFRLSRLDNCDPFIFIQPTWNGPIQIYCNSGDPLTYLNNLSIKPETKQQELTTESLLAKKVAILAQDVKLCRTLTGCYIALIIPGAGMHVTITAHYQTLAGEITKMLACLEKDSNRKLEIISANDFHVVKGADVDGTYDKDTKYERISFMSFGSIRPISVKKEKKNEKPMIKL
jgi:hypothetical protein